MIRVPGARKNVAIASILFALAGCTAPSPLLAQLSSIQTSASTQGALLISLGFSPDGTDLTGMPANVGSVSLQITGGTLTHPLAIDWQAPDPPTSPPLIRIAHLDPGTYALAATLRDRKGETFGQGTGSVTIVTGQSQAVRLLMVYALGQVAANVIVIDASPLPTPD